MGTYSKPSSMTVKLLKEEEAQYPGTGLLGEVEEICQTYRLHGAVSWTRDSQAESGNMLLIEHKRSKSKSLRFLFNIIFFPAKIGTLERNLKLCVFSKQIAMQTLVGLTRREDLEKVEARGEVMSPLKCTRVQSWWTPSPRLTRRILPTICTDTRIGLPYLRSEWLMIRSVLPTVGWIVP